MHHTCFTHHKMKVNHCVNQHDIYNKTRNSEKDLINGVHITEKQVKQNRTSRTLYCKQPVATGKKSTAPGDKNNNNSCDRINWAEQNRKALWVPSHPLSPLLANGTDRGEVLFSFSTYLFTHSTAITEPWTLLISLVCCRQMGDPVSPGYGYLSPYSQFTFLSREGSSAVRQMFH